MGSIEYFLQRVGGQREQIASYVHDAKRSLEEARFFERRAHEAYNNSFYDRARNENMVFCGRAALKGDRRIVEGALIASIGLAMLADWAYQLVSGKPRDLSYLNQLGQVGEMVKYGVFLFGNEIVEPAAASNPLLLGVGLAAQVVHYRGKWRRFFKAETRGMENPPEVSLTKENVDRLEEEMERFEKQCGDMHTHDLSDKNIHSHDHVIRIG